MNPYAFSAVIALNVITVSASLATMRYSFMIAKRRRAITEQLRQRYESRQEPA